MHGSIYTPGAGHAPPVLAGRDDLLRDWELVVNDVLAGGRVHARDLLLLGPRGIGKTVTTTALGHLARTAGFVVFDLQSVRGQTTLVASLLDRVESQLARNETVWQSVRRHVETLRSVSVGAFGISAGVARDNPKEHVVAPGRVAELLADLADAVARSQGGRGGVMVTVDELQVTTPDDLVLLSAALQRLNVNHQESRVLFAATGLPYTRDVLNSAGVTHPERLYSAVLLPITLPEAEARRAIVEPALRRGVIWEPEAASAVVELTNGYPAHLQLVADAVWRIAKGPQITQADVEGAVPGVVQQLADGTFDPRWASLPDRQREYLAALAVLGGVATASAMSRVLDRVPSDLSRIRDAAIKAGDVYSPRRGELRLSVPLFGRYILAHYDEDRSGVDDPRSLVSLEQMQSNAGLREIGR